MGVQALEHGEDPLFAGEVEPEAVVLQFQHHVGILRAGPDRDDGWAGWRYFRTLLSRLKTTERKFFSENVSGGQCCTSPRSRPPVC